MKAKVNWEKCEGLLLGKWRNKQQPTMLAGLQWATEGIQICGVFLGSCKFQKKNWEGTLEKISARLSRTVVLQGEEFGC